MFKRFIQLWARRRSLKQAIAQANHLRATNFKKHFVIFLAGEYNAVSKQRMKQLYKEGAFKKGVKFSQLEKMIFYTTT